MIPNYILLFNYTRIVPNFKMIYIFIIFDNNYYSPYFNNKNKFLFMKIKQELLILLSIYKNSIK